MKCFSNKILVSVFGRTADGDSVQRTEKTNTKRCTLYARPAFSLAESVAAMVILAFVSTSVLVVINRYMASAADSVLYMQAFEVARQNMERLLTLDTVEESVEYGYSERYPDIQWQTTVETFYEPLTSRMWIQAVCSAEYTDSDDEVQTVELTHWLTNVTKAQLLKILAQQQEQSADQIIETLEEAAEYAGVDGQTIEQWINDGMLTTEDGFFTKDQLELYRSSDGKPTIEDKMRIAGIDTDTLKSTKESGKQDLPTGQSKSGQKTSGPQIGPGGQSGQSTQRQPTRSSEQLIGGYTREELERMSIEELIKIFFGSR